jgi:enamine deaminase RidA (YjgF/YER057c/UK114 family)
MTDIQRIESNQVMSAATIFNQVVYLSGQVPQNTQQDIAGQTQEILATIERLLSESNSDKSRILSAQLFLKDLSDFAMVNQIWIHWLDGLPKPARATIQADLVNPDWLIEIAITAAQT